MKAKQLYQKLESDFIKPELSDDWASHMTEITEFISDNFKKRSMGLVCDNSKEITQVYSAVFPSERVMKEIIKEDAKDALLFVHHPSDWDITKNPIFIQMKPKLLEEFRKRRISIYNLHVPLDNFSEYSTSNCLAEAIGLKVEKKFAPYRGGLAGVICKTECKTLNDLKKKFEKAVGHKVAVYQNGSDKILERKVGVVAGGGHDMEVLPEILKDKIKVLVTGVTIKNDYSKTAHEFDVKNKINVLGGTHYSTEKFACIKMCKYFEKLGLPAKFIEDKPCLEDM